MHVLGRPLECQNFKRCIDLDTVHMQSSLFHSRVLATASISTQKAQMCTAPVSQVSSFIASVGAFGENILHGAPKKSFWMKPIGLLLGHLSGGMMHREPFIKPARPCLSTRSQPAAFALRARSLSSSSELRSLSIFEKTDGCTNYRTDPVQV